MKLGHITISNPIAIGSTVGAIAITATATAVVVANQPVKVEDKPQESVQVMIQEHPTAETPKEPQEQPQEPATQTPAAKATPTVATTSPEPEPTTEPQVEKESCDQVHDRLYRLYHRYYALRPSYEPEEYIARLQAQYKSDMIQAGCDPSQFVDF